MIHNVVDFRHVRVRDVMVPIARAVTVQPGASIDSLLQLSGSSGIDCFPIVSNRGEPVGLVNVLDVVFDQAKANSLAKYTRRMITAGEHEPAYRILRRLRAARLGLAAVLDAQRKVVGIATDDELIKRLVQSA